MTSPPSALSDERGVLGWDEFAGASRELAQIIVNDEFCAGVGTKRPESIMVQPLSDQASFLGKKVLLVDDVFGSEHTLAWPMTV